MYANEELKELYNSSEALPKTDKMPRTRARRRDQSIVVQVAVLQPNDPKNSEGKSLKANE